MAYYFKHSDLVLPDDNTIIWRYMDFSKFQSTLNKSSIFFSKADKQTDKLEGEYPLEMLDELERRFGVSQSDDGTSYTFIQWHTQREIPSRLLSCWGASINQSRKRWSTYTTSSESIAIRSTIKRLKECFHREGNDEQVVWIGKVRYGKEENRLPKSFFKWKANYFLYPFFAKNEQFRWENEIRATVNIAQKKQLALSDNPSGCFIKADLHMLIDSVWLHPQAKGDLRHKIESLLVNQGYAEIAVCQSSWNSILE